MFYNTYQNKITNLKRWTYHHRFLRTLSTAKPQTHWLRFHAICYLHHGTLKWIITESHYLSSKIQFTCDYSKRFLIFWYQNIWCIIIAFENDNFDNGTGQRSIQWNLGKAFDSIEKIAKSHWIRLNHSIHNHVITSVKFHSVYLRAAFICFLIQVTHVYYHYWQCYYIQWNLSYTR